MDHVSLHTSTRPEIHTEGLDAASVFSYHLQGDSLRELLPLPSDGNAQDVPGERARDEDGAPTPLHRLIHAYSVLSRLVHVNARRLDDLPHLGRRLTGRGGTFYVLLFLVSLFEKNEYKQLHLFFYLNYFLIIMVHL